MAASQASVQIWRRRVVGIGGYGEGIAESAADREEKHQRSIVAFRLVRPCIHVTAGREVGTYRCHCSRDLAV